MKLCQQPRVKSPVTAEAKWPVKVSDGSLLNLYDFDLSLLSQLQ